jgi:hypothetical protein
MHKVDTLWKRIWPFPYYMSEPRVPILSKEKDPESELDNLYCSPQGCVDEKIIVVSVYMRSNGMCSPHHSTSLWKCWWRGQLMTCWCLLSCPFAQRWFFTRKFPAVKLPLPIVCCVLSEMDIHSNTNYHKDDIWQKLSMFALNKVDDVYT